MNLSDLFQNQSGFDSSSPSSGEDTIDKISNLNLIDTISLSTTIDGGDQINSCELLSPGRVIVSFFDSTYSRIAVVDFNSTSLTIKNIKIVDDEDTAGTICVLDSSHFIFFADGALRTYSVDNNGVITFLNTITLGSPQNLTYDADLVLDKSYNGVGFRLLASMKLNDDLLYHYHIIVDSSWVITAGASKTFFSNGSKYVRGVKSIQVMNSPIFITTTAYNTSSEDEYYMNLMVLDHTSNTILEVAHHLIFRFTNEDDVDFSNEKQPVSLTQIDKNTFEMVYTTEGTGGDDADALVIRAKIINSLFVSVDHSLNTLNNNNSNDYYGNSYFSDNTDVDFLTLNCKSIENNSTAIYLAYKGEIEMSSYILLATTNSRGSTQMGGNIFGDYVLVLYANDTNINCALLERS